VKAGRRYLHDNFIARSGRRVELDATRCSPVFMKHGRTHETQFLPSRPHAQTT
jgi:hypothetical protein